MLHEQALYSFDIFFMTPELIYGASSAYDLKLVVQKNINDVIKPSWIKDSITLGEIAPFHHKFVSQAATLSSL